jgi:hypothetical protein
MAQGSGELTRVNKLAQEFLKANNPVSNAC